MKSLLSTFVIVVCIGAYFLYIKPLSVEVRVLGSKVQEYEDVLNQVKEIKEKRDSLVDQYNNISPENIDKLSKIIPETVNPVVVLNDMSTVGASYGVIVKDFKVKENSGNDRGEAVETQSTFKTTTISAGLTGAYPQFIEFLNEIESSLSLFDIVSLTIKQEGSGKGPQIMTYQLEANIYSLR